MLADKFAMEGMGERLRTRAREMGWSDAEVALRLGLAQTRYANYVTDKHEPDLGTFVRICTVLGTSPEHLLGLATTGGDDAGRLQAKVSAAARALDVDSLKVAAIVLDGLVARARHDPHDRRGHSHES